ncbi:hypothetical protein R75461_08014 [Paraburkholderia nemoris]|uniref:hypothetical protein n=1 Tax=Paraburkholderia nemoris TaxID=2793076 RepID=UPI00190B1375|nr:MULTISPECIES: hypothetical protein [Paraburkholderia]MBK3786780.1 hypothetical protein [Paraburkholderia aspalathi]CAE6861621.1 hypothetical protein R75461_08014 [Paraburkholderia nemoris]
MLISQVTCVAVLLLLCGCTVIHIEGNSNTVSDIEGHTTDLTVPASANKPLVAPAR